jgi:hypothetical protein
MNAGEAEPGNTNIPCLECVRQEGNRSWSIFLKPGT